jgi:hypothetical protein
VSKLTEEQAKNRHSLVRDYAKVSRRGVKQGISHMPLSTWFWGAYLMTTQTPGQSAVQFQRQLGIATYENCIRRRVAFSFDRVRDRIIISVNPRLGLRAGSERRGPRWTARRDPRVPIYSSAAN